MTKITQTHYISNGQHYLPTVLQNRSIEIGDILVCADVLEGMGDPEYHKLCQACSDEGISAEINDEGDLVVN